MTDSITQVIDPTKANIEECRRWLAGQLCPNCLGDKRVISNTLWTDAHSEAVENCTVCIDSEIKPTGLAFPWASEECGALWCNNGVSPNARDPDGICHDCNGSGRVPKAVGLEELLRQGVIGAAGQYGTTGLYWADLPDRKHLTEADDPLLAALRAVVKAGMKT